jgi:hypothetical protein
MDDIWVVIVVMALGWDGHAVEFHEFSSKKNADEAAEHIRRALKDVGGAHHSEVICLLK